MSISLFVWLWPTLVALLLLVAISRYELAWRRRRLLSEAVIGLQLASLPFLAVIHFDVLWLAVLVLMQAWVIIVAARLLFGRLPAEFLRGSTYFNSVLAIGLFVAVIDAQLLRGLLGLQGLPYRQAVSVSLLIGTAIGSGLLYQVIWTLKHYRLRHMDATATVQNLPTVTLAIPARNETHALEACLRAAVASEYPKLEIIVLDDCSQDKTSDIIRTFAREGVRFVQGAVPAEGWLGKNQALRTLAGQASGDYIIFADVDTRLALQSIGKLITFMLSNQLDMITVLPYRRDGWSLATLLPTLRYFWQVALPVTARRVPVASQCWAVRRARLDSLGGFGAVRHKIVPEAFFARQLFAGNTYRFVISNNEVGVTTAKRWSSQLETSVRFLYPTFKRQPFLVLLAELLLVAVMLLPFGVLATTSVYNVKLFVPAALASGILWLGYSLVIVRTHPLTWPVTVLLLPLTLVQEAVLLLLSMVTYEFGGVNWKGRNVCYPVMKQR